MDTRIALSGRPIDAYGALMRGWQGGEQRIQDVNAQQDRQATIAALSQRYGQNNPYGVLARTAPDVLKIENDQARLGIDQQQANLDSQKYQSERVIERGGMVLKMGEALKPIPEGPEREAAFGEMLRNMSRIDREAAEDLASDFQDLSDDGLLRSLSGYAGFGEKPPATPSVILQGREIYPEWETTQAGPYRNWLQEHGGGTNINIGDKSKLSLLNKPPAGYAWKLDPNTGDVAFGEDGQPEMVDIKGAPNTEGERKDAYVAELLQGYENDLAEVLKTFPEFDLSNGWDLKLAGGSWTNWMSSPGAQQYRAIGDEWLANTLFARSGATIPQEEKDAAFKSFFPQPGDDPSTVRRKEILRKRQTQQVISKAGRAYKPENQKKTFYVVNDGKRETVSWDEIVTTAEQFGKTPQQIIDELGLKEK